MLQIHAGCNSFAPDLCLLFFGGGGSSVSHTVTQSRLLPIMSRVEANSERGAASNRWLAKQTEWRCTAVCGRWYNPGGSITRSGDSNQTVEIVSWRQTRERVKRGGWADGVTLFAAEEDSDIISSQLLSTFPSRAVLYLLSFLIETRTAAARAAARLLGLCLWEKLFFSCSPLLFLFFLPPPSFICWPGP